MMSADQGDRLGQPAATRAALRIQRVSLVLPAGFQPRADHIARRLGEAIAAVLEDQTEGAMANPAWATTSALSIDQLTVDVEGVDPGQSDRAVARSIAEAIALRIIAQEKG